MGTNVLIIEDDAGLSQMLSFHFEDEGHSVSCVTSCAAALKQLQASAVDLVLLDQHLPDGTGLELLPQIVDQEQDIPVIMMTGMHDLDLAIKAIKSGAYDFIHKPLKIDELNHVVDKALATKRMARELEALQTEPTHPKTTGEFIGRSDVMLTVSKEIALTANSDASVVIFGESGTGKEVVARLIHNHSDRSGPFVAVNCAAIVDNLLESELFGHEKGAFTDAVARKLGKFELAQDGTLFLDEIGELAQPLQAKLLRVLQENVLVRVGGNQEISINARIIAATNRNLEDDVRSNRFREDLMYRLNVVSIHLPPLRERPQDIPLLAESLMTKISRNVHKPKLHISDEALHLMTTYSWPGNVRELENILTQAMVHARKGILTPELIPLLQRQSGGDHANESRNPATMSLDEVEAHHIQRVLDHTGGHKGKSCEILGISRPALDRKITKFNLVVPG